LLCKFLNLLLRELGILLWNENQVFYIIKTV
jgi:hypothetical protein